MTSKTSFGIRIKDDLIEELNKIVERCVYLNTSRSEVVETILWDYLKSNDRRSNIIVKAIIQKRQSKLDKKG